MNGWKGQSIFLHQISIQWIMSWKKLSHSWARENIFRHFLLLPGSDHLCYWYGFYGSLSLSLSLSSENRGGRISLDSHHNLPLSLSSFFSLLNGPPKKWRRHRKCHTKLLFNLILFTKLLFHYCAMHLSDTYTHTNSKVTWKNLL